MFEAALGISAPRSVGAVEFDEATKLVLAQQMPSTAVARIVGESAHPYMEVCNRDVEMALGVADFSDVTALAIDETSHARGHACVTLAADLLAHGGPPEQITCLSIDMSPAFISA